MCLDKAKNKKRETLSERIFSFKEWLPQNPKRKKYNEKGKIIETSICFSLRFLFFFLYLFVR